MECDTHKKEISLTNSNTEFTKYTDSSTLMAHSGW